MSILNTNVCVTDGANTGADNCPLDVKLFQFIIKVSNSFELTDADMESKETVMAALLAAINADNPLLRAYPFPPQVTFTDNSTDPAFQTFGSGAAAPANDGMYNWMFQFIKGGMCLSNKLRRFNGDTNAKFLVIDAAGNLYGTKVGTSLKGIPANYIYTDKVKAATYEAVAVYAYRVDFRPIYFNENLAFVNLNLADLLDLSGLQNIVPSLVAARAANLFTVKLKSGCANTDLYDLYGAELADVTNFQVTEAGKVITITSVTQVPNSKGFLFTLDATDPDYTAGGPFILTGSTVTALAGNGVEGFEIQTLNIA